MTDRVPSSVNRPPSGSADARSTRLPALALVASSLSRPASTRSQLRLAGRLGPRLLSPELAYRTPEGLVLRVNPEDPFQVAMAMGVYNQATVWLMRRFVRRGSTAIDAGAHIGYFSLHLARLVGPQGWVHAFEPDPRLYPRLAEHTRRNLCTCVRTSACGLLDHEGVVPLGLNRQLGWTSIVGLGTAERIVDVPMITLDAYVQSRGIDPTAISFIKIDVEGAELQVLAGARETLIAAPSVAVLIEAGGQKRRQVVRFMESLGFNSNVPLRWRRHRLVLLPSTDPGAGLDLLFLRG